MEISEFLSQAKLAPANLFTFAKFVKDTEFYFDDYNLNSDLPSLYKEKWFELEIVNAVALDDWESDGRPINWKEKWDTKYKSDAVNLIQEILKVIQMNVPSVKPNT